MAEVVFVINPPGWARAFKTWHSPPVGTWMDKTLLKTRTAVAVEAPGPGKPPRNRTGVNYATGLLESTIVETRHNDMPSRDLEGHVVALPKHAIFVSLGTQPHVIVPRKPGGLLKFRGRLTGKMVYTPKVNHPGTAANDFMVRGLKKGVS